VPARPRRRSTGGGRGRRGAARVRRARAGGRPARRRLRDGPAVAPLLGLGALGALAFAVENAHQSWSALYLRDELGAGAATAAAGPAIFAGTVGITRFAAGALSARHPALVVVAGSALAAAGTGLVSVASTLGVALAGLVLAAAGTARPEGERPEHQAEDVFS
jgi:hypothetical protein